MSYLSAEDADRASGPYFLTFGRPDSGKTTFHNFILRYLALEDEDFSIESVPFDSVDNRSEFLFLQWMKLWEKGYLSPATVKGEAQAFRFRLTPVERRDLVKLEFGIFEIAGEDYESVVLAEDNPEPSFPRGLQRFINNSRVNFIVVFMCNGDNPKADDAFFRGFLNLIDEQFTDNQVQRFWRKTPVLLIISKPNAAQNALGDINYRKHRGTGEEYIVVKEFLPMTYALLRQKEIDFEASFLKIGDIVLEEVEHEREDGSTHRTTVKKLHHPSYDDIYYIFEWCYRKWTNREIGPRRGFWPTFRTFFGI